MSWRLPPARSAFGRVGLAKSRSLATASAVAWDTEAAVSATFATAFLTLFPAVAAFAGALSFGSASSLATDALLCVFSFGTSTCVATFFRPAYVYVLP